MCVELFNSKKAKERSDKAREEATLRRKEAKEKKQAS